MVKHIVTFRFKGTAEERRDLAARFRDGLLVLPESIPCLQSMDVHLNENPAEDSDLVLTAVVPTMEDVAIYAVHPAHLAVTAMIKGRVDMRACADFTD